jgi:DNA-binding winged helix-turn-helix (wHTH) protein
MTLQRSERKGRSAPPRSAAQASETAQETRKRSGVPAPRVRRRRNIALVSASGATGEDLRRALRALGRSPWVFVSLDELRSLGSRLRQFELLVWVCPIPSEEIDEQTPAYQVRKVMGEGIPVLLAFEIEPLATGVHDMEMDIANGPFTFSRFYLLVQAFAAHHRIRLNPAPPEWGPYRFHIRTHTVSIGAIEVNLRPCEFDLAIELFYSRDRVVSFQRLDFIVAAHGPGAGEISLQQRIAALGDALKLNLTQEWQIESIEGVGYRLLAPAIPVAAKLPLAGRGRRAKQ